MDGIAVRVRAPARDIVRDAVGNQTHVVAPPDGVPREGEFSLEPQPRLHTIPPSGKEGAGETSPKGPRRIDRRQS